MSKFTPDGYTVVGTAEGKDEVVRKSGTDKFEKMNIDINELEAEGYSVMVYLTQTSLLYRTK